ncbi:putative membrane protein [Ehrlichia chaffeensis str. Liberty]|nr:putative membrane protein [Ehrlichia chaffeensis str. Liberty]AHX07687.1 putative membrane protein [Ehrlichia chaffeensis str. Osceola]AHX08395.1 putative membrane protein [Ehrlichia chaffeensis str. Saint Vincent]AHX09733.1 putative membrane protein [Ehrlichia chaffeensis str. Wakulla]
MLILHLDTNTFSISVKIYIVRICYPIYVFIILYRVNLEFYGQ